MSGLLVEEDAHGLAGLDAATDDGHQFRLDKILALPKVLVLQGAER